MVSTKVDGVLLQWGALLFYPEPRPRGGGPQAQLPKLPRSRASGGGGNGCGHATPSAADIRERIRGVVGGSPQVLVKITGTSSGMAGLRTHLRYITASGERPLSNERGEVFEGQDAVHDLASEWQCAGSLIPTHGDRREAFHIVLDMPPGTDPEAVRDAALDFAAAEFSAHRWAWALHTHQEHPHVHLVVKAEARDFTRLDPRKADLDRWRRGFAEALRSRGIRAEATRRTTHGTVKDREELWRHRARQAGTLRKEAPNAGRVTLPDGAQRWALEAWGHIHNALASSPNADDQALAQEVKAFLARTPLVRHMAGRVLEQRQHQAQEVEQRQRQERTQGRR